MEKGRRNEGWEEVRKMSEGRGQREWGGGVRKGGKGNRGGVREGSEGRAVERGRDKVDVDWRRMKGIKNGEWMSE